MTQESILRDVASYGVQAGFWAAMAFPVVTAFFWSWWQHLWGWTIVALDLAIAMVLLGAVLVIEFGLQPVDETGLVLFWVEAIALCLVPVIIVWRAVLIYMTQRRGRREEEAE